MKADEIRAIVQDEDCWDGRYDQRRMAVFAEIAAQLAELNDSADELTSLAVDLEKIKNHLEKIANPLIVVGESPWVTLSWQGTKIVIDRTVVTGVRETKFGDNLALAVSTRDGQGVLVVEGIFEEVCKKLNIPIGG